MYQVIVIYNGANQFELGFAEEYDPIKAVLWCPGTGNVGFNALGKVISGAVNPSGRTPDTFVYDMTSAPWWNNGEKTEYTNLAELAVEGMNAGKPQMEVVELYFNPPYQNGGIEKASANLIDFAKTSLLEPGQSETLTISFAAEDMASYDYMAEKAYVLEAGNYVISINRDSHTVLDQKDYSVQETIVFDGEGKRESDQIAATNVFDEAAGDVVLR